MASRGWVGCWAATAVAATATDGLTTILGCMAGLPVTKSAAPERFVCILCSFNEGLCKQQTIDGNKNDKG